MVKKNKRQTIVIKNHSINFEWGDQKWSAIECFYNLKNKTFVKINPTYGLGKWYNFLVFHYGKQYTFILPISFYILRDF